MGHLARVQILLPLKLSSFRLWVTRVIMLEFGVWWLSLSFAPLSEMYQGSRYGNRILTFLLAKLNFQSGSYGFQTFKQSYWFWLVLSFYFADFLPFWKNQAIQDNESKMAAVEILSRNYVKVKVIPVFLWTRVLNSSLFESNVNFEIQAGHGRTPS